MVNNDSLPVCRQCPSGDFDLRYIRQSRYMAICHAKECVLKPVFSNHTDQFLSKANVAEASFEVLENCPHVAELRRQGKIPWATSCIDFSKE